MAKLQPEHSEPAVKPETSPAQPSAHTSATRLAYVADLLRELRDMAAADGHVTLCGLIAVAEAEAKRCGRP